MHETLRSHLAQKALLTDAQFDELIPYIVPKHFAAGDFVLMEGEVCHHNFFVGKGLLRSYTIDEAGKEHILQFAPENWIIGDRSSYYFNEPSVMNIQAIEDTEASMMGKDFIENACEISRTFRVYNERALQNHIRHQQFRINLLLSASAEKRYLYFVDTYFDLTLRVPQWMIASYLGITPESLSRIRKDLARRHSGS